MPWPETNLIRQIDRSRGQFDKNLEPNGPRFRKAQRRLNAPKDIKRGPPDRSAPTLDGNERSKNSAYSGLRWPHFGVSQHISERCPRKYQIAWLEPEDWFFHSHSSLRWQSESPSIAECEEAADAFALRSSHF
jgi:hypothetical protein